MQILLSLNIETKVTVHNNKTIVWTFNPCTYQRPTPYFLLRLPHHIYLFQDTKRTHILPTRKQSVTVSRIRMYDNILHPWCDHSGLGLRTTDTRANVNLSYLRRKSCTNCKQFWPNIWSAFPIRFAHNNFLVTKSMLFSLADRLV